jgi:hypothetical protein
MGQTHALNLLRKWHVNQSTVIVTGQGVEHRAKVLFVDAKVVLMTISPSSQTKAIDFLKVNLSVADGGVEVTWPSKQSTLIREE